MFLFSIGCPRRLPGELPPEGGEASGAGGAPHHSAGDVRCFCYGWGMGWILATCCLFICHLNNMFTISVTRNWHRNKHGHTTHRRVVLQRCCIRCTNVIRRFNHRFLIHVLYVHNGPLQRDTVIYMHWMVYLDLTFVYQSMSASATCALLSAVRLCFAV